eukprot:m.181460 g.181460  ORF g.181460 m.181460 type:complete len:1211 (+) comp16871_c0_seq1:102-3734(+)
MPPWLSVIVALAMMATVFGGWQFDSPAMTWGALEVNENGPGGRFQHIMLSWPRYDELSFDGDIAIIHGGFKLRHTALDIPNYAGLPAYEYYFEHFMQDPIVWQWNISTLQYEPKVAFVDMTPRASHVGAAFTNHLGAERLLVIHGGMYLNGADYSAQLLGDTVLYNYDTGLRVSSLISGQKPRARAAHMATVRNNRYFIIAGGYTITSCAQQPNCTIGEKSRIETLNDLWVLDLAELSLQWQLLQPIVPISPRYFGGLMYLAGKLWIGGGVSFDDPVSQMVNASAQILIDGFDYWSGELDMAALTVNYTKVYMAPSTNKGRGVPHYSSQIIATSNESFAIYGGQISQVTYRDDIATFNTTTLSWRIRKVPAQGSSVRRGFMAATLIKDLLIFHGGASPLVAFSDMTYHFISTDMWLKPAAVVEPANRYNTAIAYLDNNTGIMYGGFDWQSAYADMWSLNYYNGDWTWFLVSQVLPIGPRFGHVMFYTGGSDVYLMFGSSMDTVFNDVWRINVGLVPVQAELVPASNAPEPRYATAAVLLAGYGQQGTIYVYGGANVVFRQAAVIDTSSVIMYSTMYAFDVATETWSNLTKTLAPSWPRMYAGAAQTVLDGEDVMLMFGGLRGPIGSSYRPVAVASATISNDVLLFKPSRNTWTLLQQSSALFPIPRHGALLLATNKSANDDATAVVHGGAGSIDIAASGYSLSDAWTLQLNSTSVSAELLPLSRGPNVSKHIGALLSDAIFIFGGESLSSFVSATEPFAVDLACVPGTYQESDRYYLNGCRACPKGTYSPNIGDAACTSCPHGTTTLEEGTKSNTSCNQCSISVCHGHGQCVVSNSTFHLSCNCREPWGGEDCSRNTAMPGIVVGTTVTAIVLLLAGLGYLTRRRYTRLKQDADLNVQLLADTQAELERAFTIAPEELTFHRRIDLDSPGMFGEVWLASFGDAKVAVKQLKASMLELDSLANDEFVAETKLMRSLRHSNIVYFYGCGVRDGNSFLVLEYMARGSLDKLVADKSATFPWRQRLELARGAAAGMQYLHSLNPPRIHRDLKSPNLLISDSFVCKVADFGTAKLCQLSKGMVPTQTAFELANSTDKTSFKMTKGVGTLLWLSPEIHDGKPYSLSSDVYSYAIVLWEIASRSQPWKEKKTSWQISECVIAGERPSLAAADTAPRAYLALMQACWQQDPNARPRFDSCVAQLDELLETVDNVQSNA